MNKNDILRYLLLRTVGNFLILFALFGVGSTFGPALYYEISFRFDQASGVKYTIADPTMPHQNTGFPGGGLGSLSKSSSERILIPKDTYFSVLIPKIGANAQVFPNVDPTDEGQYLAALKKGVAHAKGSVFPGLPGATYLFAHSTDAWYDVGRYNAVFYLLKDLTVGDQVVIFFKNKRYNYTVTSSKIVPGSDVSELTNAQTGTERVVLQTCWPPGTTLERLLVTAVPK